MRNGTFAALFLAVLVLPSCAPKETVRPGAPAQAPPASPAAPRSGQASAPRIEVLWAKPMAEGEFLEVRFKVFGMPKYDPEPESTYVVDEATGEKFFVAWLKRIGRVATTKTVRDGSTQYIMIKNPGGKLKPGAKVTVVVGAARQEHVPVEAP